MRVRWKVKSPPDQGEEGPDHHFPGELTKVMWCQGVIYRFLCVLCLCVYLIWDHLFTDATVDSKKYEQNNYFVCVFIIVFHGIMNRFYMLVYLSLVFRERMQV